MCGNTVEKHWALTNRGPKENLQINSRKTAAVSNSLAVVGTIALASRGTQSTSFVSLRKNKIFSTTLKDLYKAAGSFSGQGGQIV